MKKEELKQIYYLNQEIEMWREELNVIKGKSLVKGQEITGMPRGSNGPADTVGNLATEVANIEFVIEGKLREIQLQRKKIMDYINEIEDSLMRQIMFYRHISLMSWKVAAKSIGGGNTDDGIRKMHDRFVE